MTTMTTPTEQTSMGTSAARAASPQPVAYPRLVPVQEAASILGMHERTLRRYISEGWVAHRRPGGMSGAHTDGTRTPIFLLLDPNGPDDFDAYFASMSVPVTTSR